METVTGKSSQTNVLGSGGRPHFGAGDPMIARLGGIPMLRYAITLSITAVVAWGLWQAQRPGRPVIESLPPLTYPPSPTQTYKTQHGWPAMWLVRRTTKNIWTRTSVDNSHTVLPWGLAGDLLAWAAILACTANAMRCATGRRAQFSVRALLSVHFAAAVLLGWWGIEYGRTYVRSHPEVTEVLRLVATTPLLRLLECPVMVSMAVLAGVFCVLLHVNTCLIGGILRAWNALLQKRS